MSDICPESSSPCGMVMTLVTPFPRVNGICSLSGFTAVIARRCGFNSPASCVSPLTPAASRPSIDAASIIPG